MKILILSDASFNDSVIPLLKAMQEKNLDVTCLINLNFEKIGLISINERIPKQSIIKASEYPEMQIFNRYINEDKLFFINHLVDKKHAWRDITSTIEIMKFIKKGEFDVIQTDMVYWRSKLLLYVYRNKTLQITHDSFPHSSQVMSWQRSVSMYLKYKLFKWFVILNKTDYDKFCEVHRLKKDHVFINALGPLDFIRIYKDKNIQTTKGNVLFFGRIEEYKGIEYLCKAIEIVQKTHSNVFLTIAGSGNFYFDIEKYKKSCNLKVVNRYIEEEELAELIQSSEVTVCAYTDATQSGGVLTSFAFFKPVIASDIATMREVIKNEYNGLLVPPKNVEKLAEAIIRILTDDELKHTIEKNIEHDYLYGERSWSGIVDKYIDIYNTIIDKRP